MSINFRDQMESMPEKLKKDSNMTPDRLKECRNVPYSRNRLSLMRWYLICLSCGPWPIHAWLIIRGLLLDKIFVGKIQDII